jgi:hypothetical protein
MAVTRQQPVNNRGMVFSVQSMPMVVHASMEYVMPSLTNNCTAAEEQCFLCKDYNRKGSVVKKKRWS